MLKSFKVKYLSAVIFTVRMNHFCIKIKNFSTLLCSMIIQYQPFSYLPYITLSTDTNKNRWNMMQQKVMAFYISIQLRRIL